MKNKAGVLRAKNAQKQRDFKQRQRDAGLVPMTVWVKPENKDRTKKYVARNNKVAS